MAIPFAATTITATRVEDLDTTDGYDPPADHPAPVTIATGVRAVISPPTGTAKLVGGDRVVYEAKLTCDETSLQSNDQVTDSVTGLVWTVLLATQISAFGIKHTSAQMRLVTGAT